MIRWFIEVPSFDEYGNHDHGLGSMLCESTVYPGHLTLTMDLDSER